ncbi:S8 family serine peptidase [Kitasatospora paracochleata]|uniref:Subtilisin family serine protease n=1 Tax=Kitasatospora paracochleata TaxID=58354 RepID=A0ABT1ISP5_9ACTN|nr:S8 family serine peptidase [Kitasatospora paracochleata]MCP2308127.1 subtilisin family serine protease [Kitasatospora paracochleata]
MRVPRIRRARLGAAVIALATTGALALPVATAAAATESASASGPLLSYIVNTRANHGQVQKAEREIAAAGGTVVVSYEQIGVVIARSADTSFAAKLRQSKTIESVGASRTKGIEAADVEATVEATVPTAAPTDGSEPLWANQWDMKQIGVDQAHTKTLGSRDVVVGVLDSGIDATHEDLAPNVDASLSASCLSGKPDTSWNSWQPTTSDHGTHVAGTIAAAKNGKGMVGIAPNVRLAAVKVVDDGGFIYPEYAICGFVWAGEHHFKVTNNSYYIDPWLFNCQNDPDQAAVMTGVRRAVEFSRRGGVLNVAAAGNENYDLAHKTTDVSSPDDTTPAPRPVDDNCLSLPTELPGVVVTTSVGVKGDKSYYSSYGLDKATVAAPGGDARYQLPDTPDKNGRVLSTIPGNKYGYKQGTSMASPHTTGVVALLASTHPWAGPDELRWMLTHQADEHACPSTYDPSGDGAWKATCEGSADNNGFYGAGIINANKAADWWRI